jgi:ankyrin repeat protein
MPIHKPILLSILWAASLSAVEPSDILLHLRTNDLPWLRQNIQTKSDANVLDSRQNSPLLWAAALGSWEAVRILLDKGADPNSANAFGLTPLIAAATEPAKVKLLLSSGADPKAKSQSGQHALTVAASSPRATESLKFLLAAGAPLNEPGAANSTALQEAVDTACGDGNVKTLLAAGPNLKLANARGFAPAHAAATCSPQVLALLLREGADPNAKNTSGGASRKGPIKLIGLTPLHFAAAHRHPAVVTSLLNAGANIQTPDSRGMSPLLFSVASEDQNPSLVKLLLAQGARRDVQDEYGQDALAWARKFNNPAVLELFGEKPAPIVPARLDARGPGATAALRLLESSNETFFKEVGCIACHASNIFSFAAARAAKAGLPVDAALTEARRARVKGFFTGRANSFAQQISTGGDTDSVSYLLFEAQALGLEANPDIELAAKYTLSRQLDSGAWTLRGISRAPMEESDIHRTAFALKVLPAYLPASLKSAAQPRFALALRWLAAQPTHTTDELVSKLLGLHWGGAPRAQVLAAAKKLEAAQLPDGSWGGNPHLSGDAYSTAFSLFALREAAQRPPDAASVRAAIRWLLATQLADGSWHVKSRAVKFQPYFESGFPHGHDQWISMAATAWALAGLSETGAIQ